MRQWAVGSKCSLEGNGALLAHLSSICMVRQADMLMNRLGYRNPNTRRLEGRLAGIGTRSILARQARPGSTEREQDRRGRGGPRPAARRPPHRFPSCGRQVRMQKGGTFVRISL